MIGGRLIHMLRVTVIFPFARSAMPALQTLMEGAAACLISAQRAMAPTQKRFRGLVVPPLGLTGLIARSCRLGRVDQALGTMPRQETATATKERSPSGRP